MQPEGASGNSRDSSLTCALCCEDTSGGDEFSRGDPSKGLGSYSGGGR